MTNINSTSEKIELKNLTEKQKLRFDEIINNYVDVHNLIKQKMEEYDRNGKKYTRKDAMRDARKISHNTTSDSKTTSFTFYELERNRRIAESVEAKEYGGDHSYRTGLNSTEVKDGRLYIPRFKEGIELEEGINIKEGFTSVKILRESNKHYVILGYHIKEKIELKNLTDIQKERFDEIINSNIDVHNLIKQKMEESKKNGGNYTIKDVTRDLIANSNNTRSDSSAISFLFSELNKKIRNRESVSKKGYEEDHSYRTSVHSTKIKDGKLYIPHFKEGGIKIEESTNIIEEFTSVEILRESNKYYVVFGYEGSVQKKCKKDMKKNKYIYIISHPSFEGYYKVGISKDCNRRLSQYQIADPHRNYKMEYVLLTHENNAEIIEQHIHTKFDNKCEWVTGNLQDIIKEIERIDKEVTEKN